MAISDTNKRENRRISLAHQQPWMTQFRTLKMGKMGILKASKKYHVPYGTLWNKAHNFHGLKPGGQFRLSTPAEASLVKTIGHLTQRKVPLDSTDMCCLVKSYLDKRGIVDQKFKNI